MTTVVTHESARAYSEKYDVPMMEAARNLRDVARNEEVDGLLARLDAWNDPLAMKDAVKFLLLQTKVITRRSGT